MRGDRFQAGAGVRGDSTGLGGEGSSPWVTSPEPWPHPASKPSLRRRRAAASPKDGPEPVLPEPQGTGFPEPRTAS